jgi:hypothetical protein
MMDFLMPKSAGPEIIPTNRIFGVWGLGGHTRFESDDKKIVLDDTESEVAQPDAIIIIQSKYNKTISRFVYTKYIFIKQKYCSFY